MRYLREPDRELLFWVKYIQEIVEEYSEKHGGLTVMSECDKQYMTLDVANEVVLALREQHLGLSLTQAWAALSRRTYYLGRAWVRVFLLPRTKIDRILTSRKHWKRDRVFRNEDDE